MSEEIIIVTAADAPERVDVCICWRFLGQRCVQGSRVDLRCHYCQHRVAADPDTVRFHEQKGARIVCHECLGRLDGMDQVL